MSEEKSCIDSDVGAMLPAYEMGLLPPSDQAEFEKHVGSCDFCRSRLYQMSPFITAVQTEPGQMSPGMTGLPSQKSFEAGLVGATAGPGLVGGLAQAGDPLGGKSGAADDGASDEVDDVARDRGRLSLLDRLLPGGWRTVWTAYMPVAAAAVIAFVLIVQEWRVSPEVVHPGSFARVEAIEYVRIDTRAGGDVKEFADAFEQLDRGLDRYLDKDYAAAASVLAEAARMFGVDSAERGSEHSRHIESGYTAAVYAGISFLMTGAADSAVVYLEPVKASRFRVVVDRAAWYLAQACLVDGSTERVERAVGLLEELRESPGFGDEAAEQLEELEWGLEITAHD